MISKKKHSGNNLLLLIAASLCVMVLFGSSSSKSSSVFLVDAASTSRANNRASTATLTTRRRRRSAFTDQVGSIIPLTTPQKEEQKAISVPVPRGGGGIGLSLPGFNSQNVGGALFFMLLDVVFKKVFTLLKIQFPAQLGGCLLMASLMIVIPPLGEIIFNTLNPGAELLAKWIGVCFISGVVMLPTAPSIGGSGPIELVKIAAVIVLGALVTCFSTVGTITIVRALTARVAIKIATETAKLLDDGDDQIDRSGKPLTASASRPVPVGNPFSVEFLTFLLKGSIVSGCILIGLTKFNNNASTKQAIDSLNTVFLTLSTVAAFVFSIRLPKAFTKVVHPIFSSTGIMWIVLKLMAIINGNTFMDVLVKYKTNTLNILETGAGDLLLNLLGPTVVSFSMAIFSRRKLLVDNLLLIVPGVLVSAFGTLFGTAAFVRFAALGGEVVNNGAADAPSAAAVLRLSTLARNVVAPLAVVICNILGGNTSIQLGIVVVTGVLCATFVRSWLDAFNIHDPVSRGMGAGACGLSLGAASMATEKEAFPFAILAFIFNAVVATVIVTVPSLKNQLVQLATGSS